MDESLRVRLLERLPDGDREIHADRERERSDAPNSLLEVDAADELRHQIGSVVLLTDLLQTRDIRMRKRGKIRQQTANRRQERGITRECRLDRLHADHAAAIPVPHFRGLENG